MPGLDPGIHVLMPFPWEGVDGRDKPGHDEKQTSLVTASAPCARPPRPAAIAAARRWPWRAGPS
ncbi:hypothetical protein C7U92_03355 [Bradyrhizobium sp. WBOS7]|uniref:Uncharacterized protein n=1 Tax=Bradyrhizobium betae TaxID=244734 RepID=A0AAE9SRH9_9BRAD|nr:hypothetical protein [Bradyrhizobium sp. WBOS2]MDD1569674.1 hypothetical protein [Bradyrhizobium sp. WBOS1]MDD1575773.1 hypothetical protein [Bradyrhizobium sp. WBOS7]MDD1599638.1 hypothetical protein [Bradyrhizobium sp. WBOS16]UUO35839.1 hypothetical protein DCK84_15560 [Bradyrhizobium sp. WBOS01]UUO42146.1 hypothetical protein DCM75_16315 [Bradyrhizobium sp. WBOS02]UUO56483.1 hypothetical protein DCM79_28105 [Bradyrhizobium sp. WBOS07]UUO66477.1 hypothetical protein DCM83_15570 [Bradyrh